MFLLAASYIADLVFGDPEWFPHPVRWMGGLIGFLDNKLRGKHPSRAERFKGAVIALTVVGVSAACAYLFIACAKSVNPLLGYAAWVYAGYTTLAVKDLHVRAKAVEKEIEKGSIAGARKELSRIVSRNTADLDKDKIIVSTVESVAENTADGIVAPLFYLILGGPVLATVYKAVNTLDSMIGYKNEKYVDFGWFSARLDDIANFIPARLSGFLIAVASFLSGKGFGPAFTTMLKDGRKHPSPNSGISEAAMAGALGMRLGGTWSYSGKLSTKPFLGEERNEPEESCIRGALTISFIVSLLMVLMGVIIKWLI